MGVSHNLHSNIETFGLDWCEVLRTTVQVEVHGPWVGKWGGARGGGINGGEKWLETNSF